MADRDYTGNGIHVNVQRNGIVEIVDPPSVEEILLTAVKQAERSLEFAYRMCEDIGDSQEALGVTLDNFARELRIEIRRMEAKS